MLEDASDEEQGAVERRLAAIEARYGARLDADGRAVLRARLLELHRASAALRRLPLTTDDEPLPIFAPRPAGG